MATFTSYLFVATEPCFFFFDTQGPKILYFKGTKYWCLFVRKKRLLPRLIPQLKHRSPKKRVQVACCPKKKETGDSIMTPPQRSRATQAAHLFRTYLIFFLVVSLFTHMHILLFLSLSPMSCFHFFTLSSPCITFFEFAAHASCSSFLLA